MFGCIIMAEKAQIQFVNFLVKESRILFNETGHYNISIDFNPSGIVFKHLNQFQLNLDVVVKEESSKFGIELKTIAFFSFDASSNIDSLIHSLFSNNAPSIVFPYIRAYIAGLTALSGMPTLTLPTYNLTALGEILKANISVIEE